MQLAAQLGIHLVPVQLSCVSMWSLIFIASVGKVAMAFGGLGYSTYIYLPSQRRVEFHGYK